MPLINTPSTSELLCKAVPVPAGLDGYAVSYALSSDTDSLFVSGVKLMVSCGALGMLSCLCIAFGFRVQWREPFPLFLTLCGLFLLIPIAFLARHSFRFSGTRLVKFKNDAVVVGAKEIPGESIGGWIIVHSTLGLSLPQWRVRTTENHLSGVYLVVISAAAPPELLWISSQLDPLSTRKLKRFLRAHAQTVGEFSLNKEADSSALAKILQSLRDVCPIGADTLRNTLRPFSDRNGKQHDPSGW
jgi:hypothetical protein